jgi:hypothetical protein
MRYPKFFVFIVLILLFLNSCKKDFSVNAEWKDITIVYGLISQNDSVHYLKITKAFLGPGNALSYATISDSSNYHPGELSVRLDEYESATHMLRSIPFDTATIHTKEPGDSVFYFPDQFVFKSNAKLKQAYIYKLIIHNNTTGKEITSQTSLVNNFSVSQPDDYTRPVFYTGENSTVEWLSAKGGKRYQLVIRFHYSEKHPSDISWNKKYIDWLAFSGELSRTTVGGESMVRTISGGAFYSLLAANIPVDPSLTRNAGLIDYIFSVAADDLNTYMEVTEPSSSVVQYRPPFTNITNGIGLFSSRFVNSIDSLRLGENMVDSIRSNPKTANLGF